MAEADQIVQLYSDIHKAFEAQLKKNNTVQLTLKKLEENRAQSEDVARFSGAVGDCAAFALDKYLIAKYIPNGELTWDVLMGTVDPLMRELFEMVTDLGMKVMKLEDAAAGFHMNPVRQQYPEERIRAVMNSMLRRYDPEDEG